MSTSNPKEYITLTAGDSDNYSEVYDKRYIPVSFLINYTT